MWAIVLLGVLASAGPEVVVEARQGVDPILEREVVEAFSRAVEHRTGTGPELPNERIELKLFGGLTRLRIIARRQDPSAPIDAELELPLDRDLWEPELDALARRLYPDLSTPGPSELSAATVDPAEVEWPRWVLLGGAAAALIVGVAFTARGWSARSASDVDGLGTTRVEAEVADQQTAAWIAGGSFTVGLGLGIAGLLY